MSRRKTECGGDSDADDVPTYGQKTGNGKAVKTHRSTPSTPHLGASVSSPVGDGLDLSTRKRTPIRVQPNSDKNSEDSDSDDSDLDPDFNQDDHSTTRSKIDMCADAPPRRRR